MNVQEVIRAAEQLPSAEQQQVLKALQNKLNRPRTAIDETAQARARRLEWLKAHREEYAGQYVALSGDKLVGHGSKISEAREQALANGVENPFLIRLESIETILPAGW